MGLINKVKTGFDFFIKANRDLTHGTLKHAKDTMVKFAGQANMFRQAHKLSGVLFQFPATFECSPKNEAYLRWAVESLEKVRVVIEFRHAQWINDHTMDLLRELNAGYCIVDMPQVKNLPSRRVEATSDLAYVRFHGQNKAMWEGKASRNQRYDYEYSDEELKTWVPVIAGLNTQGAKDTYVYFNNHFRGKAARNAQTLGSLLQPS